jgi:hypothetical protein
MSLRKLFALERAGELGKNAVFNELRDALLADRSFDIQKLYELGYGDFCDALEALREWRTQRHLYIKQRDEPAQGHDS